MKNKQVFQRTPLDCTQTICHSNHQCTIRVWYLLRFIYMADDALWYKVDTKLRHVSESYTNQFFSSSIFSCLPMKVCESVQPWGMHCTCLFWNNFESCCACSHQKISIAVRHCLRGWSKINLEVYDVINCLNKNLITYFAWYLEKEKRCDSETFSIERVLNKEHFYGKVTQKMCTKS